ncbi:MAG TPA: hypothetical protein VLM40_02470, partial [Gemmata sp.]|nr:hypothetical protein [Gemmata sp.]
RLTEGTGVANPDKLLPGPPWTSGTRRQDSECSVTVISETMFLTNDGGRKLEGWMWPMSGSWSNAAGKWELPVAPAGRGVVIPAKPSGEAPRLMIADVAGTVRLFAADRGGEHLKQWRSGGEKHPAGKPTSSLVVQNDTAGNPVVAFTIENRALVCIDPERDEPRWMVKAADDPAATFVGAPEPIGAGKWLVTDLGGRVTEYDADGKKGRTLSIELPGAVPARAAAAIGGAGILVPLSDGSVVVLSLPGSHSPAPPPKSKAEGEKN